MCDCFWGEQLEEMMQKANLFADIQGLEVPDQPVGDGSCGIVFKIKDGLMLKVTNSVSEYVAALKLKGVVNPYLVSIYEVQDLGDDIFGLLMEEVEVDKPEIINPESYVSDDMWDANSVVEKIFDGIEFASEDIGFSIVNFDEGKLQEVKDALNADELKMFLDLRASVSVFQDFDVSVSDVYAGNIGQKENGNYVLFDQEMEIKGFSDDDYIRMAEDLIAAERKVA